MAGCVGAGLQRPGGAREEHREPRSWLGGSATPSPAAASSRSPAPRTALCCDGPRPGGLRLHGANPAQTHNHEQPHRVSERVAHPRRYRCRHHRRLRLLLVGGQPGVTRLPPARGRGTFRRYRGPWSTRCSVSGRTSSCSRIAQGIFVQGSLTAQRPRVISNTATTAEVSDCVSDDALEYYKATDGGTADARAQPA